METVQKRPFIEVLTGECRALAERFHLNGEEADILREFITTTAMRSWRNGRAVGWNRAREGQPEHSAPPQTGRAYQKTAAA